MSGLWPYAGCSKADTCPNTDGSPGYVSRRPSCGRGPAEQPTRRSKPNKPTMIPRGARKHRPKRLGESCMRAYRRANCDRRAKAVRALGLLAGSAEAEKAAVQGLRDEKPSVRSAAATALGSMHAEHGGISKRRWGQRTERCAGRDEFAAAASRRCGPRHVLRSAHRRETREPGADQRAIRHAQRQKKMAEMGFEEGIGFIPFAGIGHEVFKTATKNDSSPLRAAVLEAIALRGAPSLLPKISPALEDDKDVVRFTAAACVARLSGLPGNQAIRRLRNPRPLSTNLRAMNRPVRN